MKQATDRSSRSLSRRATVRLVSFTVALVVALSSAAISGYTLARQYRTTIEYGYQRALGELNEYLANLDITLEKGKYAATANQMEGLASKLWREAALAKTTLGELPVPASELTNTYKYLSQVGNFCMALTKRVAEGARLTEEDMQTLHTLAGYARTLSDALSRMEQQVESGQLSLVQATRRIETAAEAIPTLNDGFHSMEEGFEDYPTLLYDGPFSDHIQQQEALDLKGREEVSATQARDIARKLLGNDQLQAAGDSAGKLACYHFEADKLRVSITRIGGTLLSFQNARALSAATLSMEQALQKGSQALERLGFTGFVQRYYSLNNGVLTIQYVARTAQGVVCYPDIVKVGVAMDTGEAVSLDATGYRMNHTGRTLTAVKIPRAQAQKALSPLLQVSGENGLTVIPTSAGAEALCHEFRCTGEDGETVLVYVNVSTGQEESILLLVEDESGTLTV